MKVENDISECPLCDTPLSKVDDSFNNDYPKVKNSYIIELIDNALTFIVATVAIVAFVVDHYVSSNVFWAPIAILGTFYISFSVKYFLKKGKNYAPYILFQVILVSAVTALADYSFGHKGWSVDYVIPFLIICGSLLIIIISLIRPNYYKEYVTYILINAIMGFIPLIFILRDITHVYWTSWVCVLYSAAAVLGMVVFARRRLNTELKKRLHF